MYKFTMYLYTIYVLYYNNIKIVVEKKKEKKLENMYTCIHV